MPLKRAGNMLKRVLSAAVMVPLVVGLFLAGGYWWTGLLAIIAGLMAYEWFRIIGNGNPTLWAAVFGLVFGVFLATPLTPLSLVLCAAFPALLSQRKHPLICLMAGPVIALPLLGIYHIGGAAPLLLLWLVVVVWATDACAMFAGKSIGGPKLAPTLSPNKTWAGIWGGMAGSLLATGLLLLCAPLPPVVLLWAPVFTLLAQGGDLLESALKRKFHVKDSGQIIPGHGGVLDRMDSFLLTAPVLWLMLAL